MYASNLVSQRSRLRGVLAQGVVSQTLLFCSAPGTCASGRMKLISLLKQLYLSPPPPPPIDNKATIMKTHQYFWKKDFSCCCSWGTSLPSASTCGGARVFQTGDGPSSAVNKLTLTGSYSASCLAASSLAFLVFGTGGRLGMGLPLAFALATFFLYRSSSADKGGGDRLETEAEKTEPSSGESQRSIFW